MQTESITDSMSQGDAEKLATKRVVFSPLAVRCICVTASFVALACASSALGVACVVIPLASQSAEPCPSHFVFIFFGSAGGLLVLSALLLLHIFYTRNRPNRNDQDFILASKAASPIPCDSSLEAQQDFKISKEENDFILMQKSEDVSHWIEHQESTAEECFSLEPKVPAVAQDFNAEISGIEVTPL